MYGGEKKAYCEMEDGNLKMERKIIKLHSRDFLSFFFSFFFFFFSFFFFFFAFHFSKPLEFVWGAPKWKISTGKKYISRLEKPRKVTLPPLKNIPFTPLGLGIPVQKESSRQLILLEYVYERIRF